MINKTFTIAADQSRTITLDQAGDYTVKLTGSGAKVMIQSRLWLKGKEQLDLNLTIIHSAKNTSSTTSLKAVVDDAATIRLQGTIIVTKKAQLTNAFLEERILLLSPQAKADAIPNLEIEANDVKCSHAAAIGKINEEQVFYLQSKGIPAKQAQTLIAKGFLL
jgi:Fe-S cluster assembly protein SufD